MTSANWIRLILALAIGAGAGLVYGWSVDPIQYIDVTPNILRQDYRADYVLMVAEAFHNEYDSDSAARRLASLGGDPPAHFVSDALDYARQNRFSQNEIAQLQELLAAMQAFQPGAITAP